MARAIFISYRRDDSEGEAGRLYDDLVRVFGNDAVFMDVSGIHPGKDFRQAIEDNVAQCAVLLAVIGPVWASIIDATGVRRVDQPNDFVRLEIASALKRGVDVIPLLVHGARMPTPAQLPDDLQNLSYRNSLELNHVTWNSDVERLSRTLREYVRGQDVLPTRAIHRAIDGTPPTREITTEPITVQAVPTPAAPEPQPAPAKPPRNSIRRAGAILVIVAVVGAAAYVLIHLQLKHQGKEEAAVSQGSVVPVSANTSASPSTTTPSSGAPSALLGTWINLQPQIGKPSRVQIMADNGSLTLHLWSRCGSSECDLGTQTVALSGDGITVQWTGPFSNAHSEQVVSQTVAMWMYPVGSGLHIIFSGAQAGTIGFDFVRQ